MLTVPLFPWQLQSKTPRSRSRSRETDHEAGVQWPFQPRPLAFHESNNESARTWSRARAGSSMCPCRRRLWTTLMSPGTASSPRRRPSPTTEKLLRWTLCPGKWSWLTTMPLSISATTSPRSSPNITQTMCPWSARTLNTNTFQWRGRFCTTPNDHMKMRHPDIWASGSRGDPRPMKIWGTPTLSTGRKSTGTCEVSPLVPSTRRSEAKLKEKNNYISNNFSPKPRWTNLSTNRPTRSLEPTDSALHIYFYNKIHPKSSDYSINSYNSPRVIIILEFMMKFASAWMLSLLFVIAACRSLGEIDPSYYVWV